MLIVGGTNFIGRTFSERAFSFGEFQMSLLNRGKTNPGFLTTVERLLADRNDEPTCGSVLSGRHFNVIVDFSCMSVIQLENILANCSCDHYTFLSSSAVELSWPGDDYFRMAQDKLWCEQLVQSACDKALIVRPGFVVGKYDPTDRFEKRGPTWFWKGTQDEVRPIVEVELLTSLMYYLVTYRHAGIVRAGYHQPRVSMNSNFNP